MSGDQALGVRTTKNHTAHCIDCNHFGLHLARPHVLDAPSERATGAGGAKQVINFARQRGSNLMHSLVMCKRVVRTAILVGPKTVFDGAYEFLDALKPTRKKLSRFRVRIEDYINFGTV